MSKKLNRVKGKLYGIREKQKTVNGVYEGYLEHDSVQKDSIMVEDSKGHPINNVFITTSREKPWKTHIKVYTQSSDIVIYYDSEGDVVDADDYNTLKDKIDSNTQKLLLKPDITYVDERDKEILELIKDIEGGEGGSVDLTEVKKDIKTLQDGKADIYHSHNATEVVETDSRNFVTSEQLEDINTISNKTDRDYVDTQDNILLEMIEAIDGGGEGGVVDLTEVKKDIVNLKAEDKILHGKIDNNTESLVRLEELHYMDVDRFNEKLGSLSELDTRDKYNLVAAINEVNKKVADVDINTLQEMIDINSSEIKRVDRDVVRLSAEKADQTEIERIEAIIKDIGGSGGSGTSKYVLPRTTYDSLDGELFLRPKSNNPPETDWQLDRWGTWEKVGEGHYKTKKTDYYRSMDTEIKGYEGILLFDVKKENQTHRHIIQQMRDGKLVFETGNVRGDKTHEVHVKPGDRVYITSLFDGEVFIENIGSTEKLRLSINKNGEIEEIANRFKVEQTLLDYVLKEEFQSKVGDLKDLTTSEKGNLVEAINSIETTGGSSKYVIPRTTKTPEKDEIYAKEIETIPFRVLVDRVDDAFEQDGTEFIAEDIDGYASVYLSIIDGEGKLNLYFKNTTGYYSYTHRKINGDEDSSGWVRGDKEITIDVNTGDIFSLNTGSDLIFGYKEPDNLITKELFYNGEPVCERFDPVDILADIGQIKSDMRSKADKTYVEDEVQRLEDKISNSGGGGGRGRSATIVLASYNSHKNSKESSDIIIEKGEDASIKINDAIQSLKETGGEVKLMEGTYSINYEIKVDVPNVHLTGIPGATILRQNSDWDAFEDGLSVIDVGVTGAMAAISNLVVHGSKEAALCHGIHCTGVSYVSNCKVDTTGEFGDGIHCTETSYIDNCHIIHSGRHGVFCTDKSQIRDCTIADSEKDGLFCDTSFEGICTFNILINDSIADNSKPPAIVTNNIVQGGH